MDLRNLPEPVLRRLDEHRGDRAPGRWHGVETLQKGRVLEARLIDAQQARVELRRTEAGDPVLDGYATVYEYPYEVAGGPPFGWSETIAAGAAAKSVRERDPVVLLYDHEGMPYAATKSKTLTLSSDDIGLHVSTPNGLDMRNPDVQALVSAMERGDVDEMSFAFQAVRQEWNEDYTERRILEVRLFDVSVVTFPANPATVAQLRSEPTPEPEPEPVPAGIGLAYARALAANL